MASEMATLRRCTSALAMALLAVLGAHGLPASQLDKDKALSAAARVGNSSGVLFLLYHGGQPDGFIDEEDEGASVCGNACVLCECMHTHANACEGMRTHACVWGLRHVRGWCGCTCSAEEQA